MLDAEACMEAEPPCRWSAPTSPARCSSRFMLALDAAMPAAIALVGAASGAGDKLAFGVGAAGVAAAAG